MYRLSLLSLILLGFGLSLQAQTNSVYLKDGLGTIISSHNTIASAYGAIPAALTQAYVIELLPSYNGSGETFPVTFTNKTGASWANSITLRPEMSVTAITITGAVTGSSLFILNDADYMIIDGRPGGIGTTKALTFNNTGTSTTSYDIHLQNGASFNIFTHFKVTGYRSASSGGHGIYIGASASNPSGNSYNRFEHLHFYDGLRYYLRSSGTAANPNRNLVIYGCEFENIAFSGVWQQSGTGKLQIDSCEFYSTTASGTSSTGSYAILSDAQIDTILITRNKLYNLDNSNFTTVVYGMCFRSFNAGSVLRIYNNFISMMAPNPSSNSVIGIEMGTISANSPVDAILYNNTVRIGGTATGGTAGNVNSAAFQLDASNAGSSLIGKNNIFINERTGGSEQHVSTSLITFLGTIQSNYNVFQSATSDFGRLGTTVFPDFTTYAAAIVPNDTNSHDSTVYFVSNTDLHLTGGSVLDTALFGEVLIDPYVQQDIDNGQRVAFYRGADEVGCDVPPQAFLINDDVTTLLCEGDSISMFVAWTLSDIINQWRVKWYTSTDDNNYTPMAVPENDTIHTTVTYGLYYRYELKCVAGSGPTYVSASSLYTVIQTADAGNLIKTQVGPKTMLFEADGSVGTAYTWYFGDGTTANTVLDTITHVYADSGDYVVSVVAKNSCGKDSAAFNVRVELSTGIATHQQAVSKVVVFPNPVNDLLTIRSEGEDFIQQIGLYDLRGSLLLSRTALKSKEVKLNTRALRGGSYVLRVETYAGTMHYQIQVSK